MIIMVTELAAPGGNACDPEDDCFERKLLLADARVISLIRP